MQVLSVSRSDQIIHGNVKLPLSKSISNRVLIIQGITGYDFPIEGLSDAYDTILLKELLFKISKSEVLEKQVVVDCQNAGTVFRFLTALLAKTKGQWFLTGSSRMKERPIGPLVDALRQLGAQIKYADREGVPPLIIEGRQLTGGRIEIDAETSSQFVSAILMITPVLPGGLELISHKMKGSLPYIMMTLRIMDYFGIKAVMGSDRIVVREQPYKFKKLTIESDWSSAAFWYELAAFSHQADIVLEGLTKDSVQGDAILHEIFDCLGVKTKFIRAGAHLTRQKKRVSEFNFDFSDYPDIALPVINTCIGLNIPFNITGLGNLRFKESDRISALRTELRKLGFEIHLSDDFAMSYQGCENMENFLNSSSTGLKRISTYYDHRMAMAFAPLSMICGVLDIENPDVVAKSYQGFWDDMRKTGFILTSKK